MEQAACAPERRSDPEIARIGICGQRQSDKPVGDGVELREPHLLAGEVLAVPGAVTAVALRVAIAGAGAGAVRPRFRAVRFG